MPKKKTRPKAKTKKLSTQPKSVSIKTQSKEVADKSILPTKRPKDTTQNNISGSFRLFARACKLIADNWRLFLTITAVYGLLSIILVPGIVGRLDVVSLKDNFKGGVSNNLSQLTTGTSLLANQNSTSTSSATSAASVYQPLIVVLVSLVIIWALRQVLANHKIKARDAFYKSTQQLVPFILVLLVVSLQLLPLLFGAWIFATVNNAGLASNAVQSVTWLLLFALLAILSLYMVSSSVFGLYVVTLPDMRPMKAIRSAKALVKNRRWTVLRKVLFLPFAILILGIVIMIPAILILTMVAGWIFFALSMFSLSLVHSYMYLLYRELL